MYYCIDCYSGNGKDKPYPSDHVLIFGEYLNEVITKFGELNKSACFECWEQVYLQIKFLSHFKIQIDSIGVFQLEKPGSIQNEA